MDTNLKYTKEELIQRLRFDYEHDNSDLDDLSDKFNLILQVLENNNLITSDEKKELKKEFKTMWSYLYDCY